MITEISDMRNLMMEKRMGKWIICVPNCWNRNYRDECLRRSAAGLGRPRGNGPPTVSD
jgi:hypothetical protein